LDQSSFNLFNGLRQQHFPVDRNFLPAHVTGMAVGRGCCSGYYLGGPWVLVEEFPFASG
jgi:hypothetical protein